LIQIFKRHTMQVFIIGFQQFQESGFIKELIHFGTTHVFVLGVEFRQKVIKDSWDIDAASLYFILQYDIVNQIVYHNSIS
jgi:hypothetical protein